MCSFLQMQLPFSSHGGIRTVMLNIPGLSLAIKRGQVFVIEKKTQRLEGPPGCPEFLSVLCRAGILTFPHCLHLPSCLRRCTQWCLTKFCKQGIKICYSNHWHLALSGTIHVKFVNRERKSPFSRWSNSWSKTCSRHSRKLRKPPKL